MTILYQAKETQHNAFTSGDFISYLFSDLLWSMFLLHVPIAIVGTNYTVGKLCTELQNFDEVLIVISM